MKVKETDNGIVIVSLSDRFQLGDETTKCYGAIRENLNHNRAQFIIDLGDMEWIDSVGIGTLVTSLVSGKSA